MYPNRISSRAATYIRVSREEQVEGYSLDAKQKRAEERRLEEEHLRLEEEREFAQWEATQKREEERMAHEEDLKERHWQLASFVDGIYIEVSKLANKKPLERISDLTLRRTNRAIKSAKELLADENDEFVDEIEEFVPAGDLPEGRDVVMTLRLVKDALGRMADRHNQSWSGRY